MEDIFSMMGAIAGGVPPRIARDVVKGITISTVDSLDLGLETALLDMEGAHPVERYHTQAEADKGHKKWVKFAQNYKKDQKVTKLGYGTSIEDTEIVLKPFLKQVSQNPPHQLTAPKEKSNV